jgi:uncharacterized protein
VSDSPTSYPSRAEPGPLPRNPRPLTAIEQRVLGSLLEKQQAVPDSYPMTMPALVAACNQKTNREPVTELEESQVNEVLRSLMRDVFVWRREGARTLRWEHNVDRRWRTSPAGKAVMTLLLLRGTQTPGELRGRAERLHPFSSVAEVEATLEDLATGEEPLVRQLAREPGQKESRWIHLLGDPAEMPVAAAPAAVAGRDELVERVAALEERLARIESKLGTLLD